MHKPVVRTFALVCLVLFTIALNAQTTGTGTLVGTVTDRSGAVISGGKVTVVNTDTAFISETKLSDEGSYFVPYLAPGTYRMTIEAPGFKTYVRDGLQIRTGEIPRIDVQMDV